MDVVELKKIFREHVSKYNMDDVAIIRKFYHSYRVMDFCILLARDNHFNIEDIEIATLIGLLHDYSRFEQWTRFGTFSDINSVDHGDLAVVRLFDENEIIRYCEKDSYYDLIKDAIKYHNKYCYPDTLSDRNKMFCKIIRDADKLDIFYLLGINEEFILEDDEEISDNIKKEFYSNKPIKHSDIKNKSDGVILKLAMVFDLNFDYSFRYVYYNNMIDKIFENIFNKAKFLPYFNYVKSYIKKKIDG